ncbi:methionyl-tRNA formyltransferase [Chloroflexota bacterium]
MKIILIGQAAFGAKVLESLLDRGEQVLAVYVPPDAPGGKPDPLKELAQQKDIPVSQPGRMCDPGVYEGYVKLAPELGVMAFVTDIVPASILNCPKLGTIQYHPSLLPKHRGGSALNWPIIQGETKTGLTIFWPDGGIDTGPILLQKEVDILPNDTTGSLYFNKLFPLGVEAMIEALDLVQQGKAPRIPQDESKATYDGLCREGQSIIDWAKPASEVHNLIRGTDPQPGATTRLRGEKIKVFDAELLPQSNDPPSGEIIKIDEQGIVVSSHDGCILIKRVQSKGMPKMKALEYAATVDLKKHEFLA